MNWASHTMQSACRKKVCIASPSSVELGGGMSGELAVEGTYFKVAPKWHQKIEWLCFLQTDAIIMKGLCQVTQLQS